MDSGNLTIRDIRHMNTTGMVYVQIDEDTLSISFCCMDSGITAVEDVDSHTLNKTQPARPSITLPSLAPLILLKVIDSYACFSYPLYISRPLQMSLLEVI